MKILHLINSTYQVTNDEETTVHFQGSLSECESYVNLQNQ
jgi:hypothetical protein